MCFFNGQPRNKGILTLSDNNFEVCVCETLCVCMRGHKRMHIFKKTEHVWEEGG